MQVCVHNISLCWGKSNYSTQCTLGPVLNESDYLSILLQKVYLWLLRVALVASFSYLSWFSCQVRSFFGLPLKQ